jgi:hypothetical protein
MKVKEQLVGESIPDQCIQYEYDEGYWEWSAKLDKESIQQLDSDMESDEPPF